MRFKKNEIAIASKLATKGSIDWIRAKLKLNSEYIYKLAFEICQKNKISKLNFTIFKSLLKAGIDINKKELDKRDELNRKISNRGYTCLMSAIQFGHINFVSEILLYSPNLNVTDMYGRTALMWAVIKKSEVLIPLLKTIKEIKKFIFICSQNQQVLQNKLDYNKQ